MGYVIYFNSTLWKASQLTYVAQYRAAIAKNHPPVQFSLCIWGEAHVWAWGARVVCRLFSAMPRLSVLKTN